MPTLNTKPPRAKKKTSSKAEAAKIYNSPIWKGLRLQRLAAHPICEICGKEFATEVHHIKPFMKYYGLERLQVAYDSDNLIALCEKCHHNLHNEDRKRRKK